MKEISRLRMKFICYNMLIVTAVIGITFCAVAFVMEKRVSAQGRLALAKVVSQEEHPLIFTTRSPAQTPYFSVMVGEDGMVTPWEGGYEAFPGQEFLEEMAFLGMAGEEDMGLLEGYHLRYLRVSRPTGYMIAFADTSYEDALRNGVMQYVGLACAGIWIGFLVLSYFFSRWAVKPVEESIRMQKQFVADASHELKTPMTTIGGFVDGILDGTIPKEKHHQYLAIVSGEVKRLSRMVRSMLDLAKIEAGEMKLNPAEFDLNNIVCQVIFSFEQAIESKNLDIIGLDVDKIMVSADPDLMHQVIYNLIENAVKFVNEGGYIEVKYHNDGARTLVAIRNSGTGIAPQDLPNVFERFYKTDRSRSQDKTGVGLGLYIVRTVIQLHGGEIHVSSKEGEYTEFAFSVPSAGTKNSQNLFRKNG